VVRAQRPRGASANDLEGGRALKGPRADDEVRLAGPQSRPGRQAANGPRGRRGSTGDATLGPLSSSGPSWTGRRGFKEGLYAAWYLLAYTGLRRGPSCSRCAGGDVRPGREATDQHPPARPRGPRQGASAVPQGGGRRRPARAARGSNSTRQLSRLLEGGVGKRGARGPWTCRARPGAGRTGVFGDHEDKVPATRRGSSQPVPRGARQRCGRMLVRGRGRGDPGGTDLEAFGTRRFPAAQTGENAGR